MLVFSEAYLYNKIFMQEFRRRESNLKFAHNIQILVREFYIESLTFLRKVKPHNSERHKPKIRPCSAKKAMHGRLCFTRVCGLL